MKELQIEIGNINQGIYKFLNFKNKKLNNFFNNLNL